MTRRRMYWVVLAIGAIFFAADFSYAQPVDFGQRPTFSPWLGLYQHNTGPLDNYHTFVRPRMSLNNSLVRNQADIQRNYSGINSLNQDVSQMQNGEVRPTGTGSVYMSYSHYYPMMGRGAQPAQVGSRRSWKPQPASSGRSMSNM